MLQLKAKPVGILAILLALLIGTLSALPPYISAQANDNTAQVESDGNSDIVVRTEMVTVENVIENSTIEIPADDLYEGETIVSVKGNEGLTKELYNVRFENDVEVSRVLVHTEVVTKPVDSIVYVGTKKKQSVINNIQIDTTKPEGNLRYIDVVASAYDLSYASCGKRPGDRGYGITASGMRAQVGVVAVDPRVIPLGTRLYIEAVDGSWVYGNAIAGDTGGAIKGNRVDLFFDTYDECIRFGRRKARVYILD